MIDCQVMQEMLKNMLDKQDTGLFTAQQFILQEFKICPSLREPTSLLHRTAGENKYALKRQEIRHR